MATTWQSENDTFSKKKKNTYTHRKQYPERYSTGQPVMELQLINKCFLSSINFSLNNILTSDKVKETPH
jgi:hypothetical protein